tara:strand:- start:601 stop:783 length:183 start_codon:yes stop_codon:yes gene_type:complete
MFKTIGFPWKEFDTYKNEDDETMLKYYERLGKLEFSGGVKIVKVETNKTIIRSAGIQGDK